MRGGPPRGDGRRTVSVWRSGPIMPDQACRKGAYGVIEKVGNWSGVRHFESCWMCHTCGVCRRSYHGQFCPCQAATLRAFTPPSAEGHAHA